VEPTPYNQAFNGMAFIPFFKAKDRENLEIGMENRQSDGFFGSLPTTSLLAIFLKKFEMKVIF
jgi:hypothetical protein